MAKGKKSGKSKDNGIKVNIITRELPVQLTDAELLVRGQQLVESMVKAATLEEARKKENKRREGEIALQDEITGKLSRAISARSEDRKVECEERWDYVHKVVRVVRRDTGELVDERVMTTEELQETIAFKETEDKEPRGPAKGKGGDPFASKGDGDMGAEGEGAEA